MAEHRRRRRLSREVGPRAMLARQKGRVDVGGPHRGVGSKNEPGAGGRRRCPAAELDGTRGGGCWGLRLAPGSPRASAEMLCDPRRRVSTAGGSPELGKGMEPGSPAAGFGPKFGAHTGRDRTRRLRGVSRCRGRVIAPLRRGSGATGRRGRSGAEERRGAEPVEAAARVYGGAWGGVGSRAAARVIKRQGEAGIAVGRSGIRIPANSPVIAGVRCAEGEEKELTGGPCRSATESAGAG